MKIKFLLVIIVIVGLTGTAVNLLFKDDFMVWNSTKPTDQVSNADSVMPPDPVNNPVLTDPLTPASQSKPDEAIALNNKEDIDVFEVRDDNPEYETFYDRYQDIAARRAGLQFDPDELYQEMQKPSAWEELPEAPANLGLSDAELHDGRSFIKFSSLKMESLAAGDTLKISIEKDDIDFVAKISKVRSEGEGESVTWFGESNTPGSTDTIAITQADGLTVGGIFTDQGLYQLEVKDGQGYIVNNATLFRHGEDKQVYVPPEYLENPPDVYVELETETFGVSPTQNH